MAKGLFYGVRGGEDWHYHQLWPSGNKLIGYSSKVIFESGTKRIERIRINPGEFMLSHFHPQKDETLTVMSGTGYMGQGGREGRIDLKTGTIVYTPRGIPHDIYVGVEEKYPLEYLIVADGNINVGEINSSWWCDPKEGNGILSFTFAVYPFDDPVAQALAFPLMNQVVRWKKEKGFYDHEEYLMRALDGHQDIKIIVLYDADNGFKTAGAGFIGTTDGYDLEKTQAIVAWAKKDIQLLGANPIWLNYQSWEDLPGNPTAFSERDLRYVWFSFKYACKDAFPEADSVIVRSRHHDIWSYVYTAPWELVAEVDMRGFEWTAPDGKVFKGYDDRFSRYGILRLPLK